MAHRYKNTLILPYVPYLVVFNDAILHRILSTREQHVPDNRERKCPASRSMHLTW